jgi:LemA protein
MHLTKPAIFTGVLLSIMFIIGIVFVGNYNTLVQSKAHVDQTWGSVETAYQRRLDLVNNLVGSVKGAQGQEQKVIGEIADARTKYAGAQTTSDKASAATGLDASLGRLLVIQENYPDLKSNQNVLALQTELTGTENGIQAARDNYNSAATDYNVGITRFPSVLFANVFGYHTQSLFKADASASAAPQVNLGQ